MYANAHRPASRSPTYIGKAVYYLSLAGYGEAYENKNSLRRRIQMIQFYILELYFFWLGHTYGVFVTRRMLNENYKFSYEITELYLLTFMNVIDTYLTRFVVTGLYGIE